MDLTMLENYKIPSKIIRYYEDKIKNSSIFDFDDILIKKISIITEEVKKNLLSKTEENNVFLDKLDTILNEIYIDNQKGFLAKFFKKETKKTFNDKDLTKIANSIEYLYMDLKNYSEKLNNDIKIIEKNNLNLEKCFIDILAIAYVISEKIECTNTNDKEYLSNKLKRLDILIQTSEITLKILENSIMGNKNIHKEIEQNFLTILPIFKITLINSKDMKDISENEQLIKTTVESLKILNKQLNLSKKIYFNF